MDFRRIELIFLIVFIGLNIFLFGSYNQNQNIQKISSNSTTKSETILKEIKQDNITVGNLSSKPQQGYYLASQSATNTQLIQNYQQLDNQKVSFNGSTLNSKIQAPVKYDKGKGAAVAENFIKNTKNVLFGDSYAYEKDFSTDGWLVFLQKVPEGELYDERGMIIFKTEDNQLTAYSQTYIDQVSVLKEKEPTISEQDAVIKLYTYNEIPSGATVKWTKLAYTWLLDAKGRAIFIPAWHIGIANKNNSTVNVRRINAFSGTLMKNQSDV